MKPRDREDCLRQFPKLQRWINTCAHCGRQGYQPEMLDEYFHAGIAAHYIRSYFEPLSLQDNGLCPECVCVIFGPKAG